MQLIQSQLDALQQQREHFYANATAQFYKRNHPNFVKKISNQILEQRVKSGLLQGRALSISDSDALTIYVNLVVLGGPEILMDEKICLFITAQNKDPNAQVRRLGMKIMGYLESLKESQVTVASLRV